MAKYRCFRSVSLLSSGHLEIATMTPVASRILPQKCNPTFYTAAPISPDLLSSTHTTVLFDIELIGCSSYPPRSTIEIKMAKTTTLKEFESVFPKLVEDILDHAKKYNLPEDFVQWYKAVRNPD
jgi:hypothetical protein